MSLAGETRAAMIASIAILVVGGYAALVAGMYAFQRNLLYLPSRATPSPEASGLPEMEVLILRTTDGLELRSWYRATARDRATIVHFHGNGGHIGYRAHRIRPFLDKGFGVLLVEYRGYGGNPGEPTEDGLYKDGRAAMAFLSGLGGEPPHTVLYGESLGSGIAVHIASEWAAKGTPVAALVLEAPLSSVADVGAYHYPYVPVRLLLKDRFESSAKIGNVAAPVLIVHGERDRVVPVRFGRALFEAAVEPKKAVWIPEADHEDLGEHGLHHHVAAFLRDIR